MHKFLILATALFAITFIGIPVVGQKFSDFRVKILDGPFKEPSWMAHAPDGQIRDREGNYAPRPYVNFGGKYFVDFHQCGYDCLYMTITDVSTGADLNISKRFDYSNPALFRGISGKITSNFVLIKPDSRLLVIQTKYLPSDNSFHNICKEASFALTDFGLEQLRTPRRCIDRSLETYGYSVGPELPRFTPDWSEFFPDIAGCTKVIYPLQTNGLNVLSQSSDYRSEVAQGRKEAVDLELSLMEDRRSSVTYGQCGNIQFTNVVDLASKPTKAQVSMAKSFDRTEKLLGSFSYFPGPIPERTELKINGLRAVLTAGYSNDDTIDVTNYKWVTLEVTIANGKSVRISGLSDELKIKTVATTINYHALAEAMDEYSAKYRDAMGEN